MGQLKQAKNTYIWNIYIYTVAYKQNKLQTAQENTLTHTAPS